MITLFKIHDTVFTAGDVQYIDIKTKTVTIDGLEYSNEQSELVTVSVKKGAEIGLLSPYNYDFGIDGLFSLKFDGYMSSNGILMPRHYSDNSYVNVYMNLYNQGFYNPHLVKYIGTFKGRSMWDDIEKQGCLAIDLHHYGFNNVLWADIPTYHVLRMKTEHRRKLANVDRLQYFFKRKYNFDFTEEITTDILLRFFNIKINQKQNNKHETSK